MNELLKTDSAASIQSLFRGFMAKSGVGSFVATGGLSVREKMFEFFSSEAFLELYFQLAIEVAKDNGCLSPGLLLQKTPTPRVFRVGDHGTSFHSDYWYGHGERSFTIWTPLSEIKTGNTFWLCNLEKNDYYLQILSNEKNFIEIESKIIDDCYPAMPKAGTSVIFSSKRIHGSPKNISNSERISFDFRIAFESDSTSTKDLSNFYRYDGLIFTDSNNLFVGKKFIKYICGGSNKSTTAQHLMIESASKHYNISIDGQEAEIERFGHPMFYEYLNGLALKKGFDGIVVASSAVLSSEAFLAAQRSSIVVYCALENVFLSKY
jgi:hypothetical protein